VWQPLALELAFGLGRLALGWLVYGRKPMPAGETDRVEAGMRKVWLGWLYELMRDRFRLDEFYQATFVRGSIWLVDLSYRFDHGLVDRLVNFAGRVGRAISCISDWLDANIVDTLVNLAGRVGIITSEATNAFDFSVVDGAVNGVGGVVTAGGRAIRPIQTGRVQNYLLLASLMALVAAFSVIPLLLM